MAETLTRALHTPTPPESVSEVPEPDPVEEFLDFFSTPVSLVSFNPPKDKEKHFRNKLNEYLENGHPIDRLKGPEQPALPLIAKSHGDVEALKVLLESECFGNTEIHDSHGRTALSHASELQNHNFVELLLQKGANTDAKDNDGRTPLSWAAATGHGITGYQYDRLLKKTISGILMSHGADINSEDNEKRTPLIWAIMQRSARIINELLDQERIKVNCRDNNGQTPLILAAKKQNHDLMKRLIQKKANTSLRDADHCTFFYRLLEARQRSRKDGKLRFEVRSSCGGACLRRGNPTLCRDCSFHEVFSFREVCSFLETAFDNLDCRDEDGCTLLWWAVEFEDSQMVKALLEEGANPNLKVENPSCFPLGFPFLKALEVGSDDIISPFVPSRLDGFDGFAKPERQKDNTSLHHLIQNKHIGETSALKMLRKALQMGYKPNQRNPQGNTLLHYAIIHRKESLALELIYKLCEEELNDPKQKTKGDTPLYYALKNGMRKIVLNLMHRGAKVDLSHRDEWFKLGGEGTSYIRFSDSQMFELIKSPNKDDWMPNDDKRVLCLHKETDMGWSRLEELCNFSKQTEQTVEYFRHECFENGGKSHISVSIPHEENQIWGIEWNTTQNETYGFTTTIPHGIIPNNGKELCKHFIEFLHKKWEGTCFDQNKQLEDIHNEQLEKQGKSRKIIQALAQNLLRRAELRRCLQQHVEGLTDAIQNNDSLYQYVQDIDLPKIIDNMNKSVDSRLDSLEQFSKELLQIEFAWVSISEATSIKHISLITFVFLPLIFASVSWPLHQPLAFNNHMTTPAMTDCVKSLFGMNVNLLADNPDWKWYLVIGAASLLLTLAIWMIFKLNSTGFFIKAKSFLNKTRETRDFVSQQEKPNREDSSDGDSIV